jgi:hypothetical protein
MKCIYCHNDTRYKARADSHSCHACGRRFAFEPRFQDPKVTDEMFQKAIDDVSSRGSLYFTRSNLRYALNRRASRTNWRQLPWGLSVIGIFWIVIALGSGLTVGAVLGAALLLPTVGVLAVTLASRLLGWRCGPPLKIDALHFDILLRRWESVHGNIGGRLLGDSFWNAPARTAISPALNEELNRYSFDRAVVTDRAEPAALLVANKFHVDHECAVLSLDGYPADTGATLLAMLRQNPELRVMAVHDASPGGCALPLALRDESWFGEQARVIDLGLRPREGLALGIPVLETFGGSMGPAKDLLTPREAAWLESGKRLELAALPPERLMSAISRGFSRFEAMLAGGEPAANDSGIWYVFGDSDGDDADETFG